MPIRESVKENPPKKHPIQEIGKRWIGMDRDGSRKLEPIQAKGSPAAVAMNQTKE